MKKCWEWEDVLFKKKSFLLSGVWRRSKFLRSWWFQAELKTPKSYLGSQPRARGLLRGLLSAKPFRSQPPLVLWCWKGSCSIHKCSFKSKLSLRRKVSLSVSTPWMPFFLHSSPAVTYSLVPGIFKHTWKYFVTISMSLVEELIHISQSSFIRAEVVFL